MPTGLERSPHPNQLVFIDGAGKLIKKCCLLELVGVELRIFSDNWMNRFIHMAMHPID